MHTPFFRKFFIPASLIPGVIGLILGPHAMGVIPSEVTTYSLNDADTCEPLAFMSGNLISAVRTRAVPGVGVRYLARKDAEVCTVIGAGPVNKACFQAIVAEAKNLKKVVVYDLFEEKSTAFVQWAKDEFGIEGQTEVDLETASKQGDVIAIAASRLKPVMLKNEWVKAGSLTILTGPALLDDEYWCSSKIIFDNAKMHENYMVDAIRTGDVAGTYGGMIAGQIYQLIDDGKLPPIQESTNLGDVMLSQKQGRTSPEDRIAFITGGMAVLDVGWGKEIYDNAKKLGVGTELKLWDSAHWI